jgi:glycosyltransferase involved in cell wall biosynthesis
MRVDTGTRTYRRRVRREGAAIARAAGISAPSQDVLDRTRAHYGEALPEARVIPNPLHRAGEGDRWASARCDPGRVLFVGRFDNHKGGDVVIDAFAKVHAAEPDARLVFVGPDRGLTDAGGRSWQLRDYVAHRFPREADRASVEWVGEQRAPAIQELRRTAALTLVASRWETFGYTLAEAMMQGCPVVATATGGMAEMVTDGQDGRLVRPGDPDDLARGTLELLRDPARAAAMGARAAETAARRLSPEQVADETIAFYRRVLDRR